MSDLDLAALMGVGTHEVLTALRIPIQQGAVTFLRMPGERRMLGLTETGVAHLTMIDLEPRVLDLLDSFGPRSPLDISQDLAVGREITQVLAKLTQGGWITGWDAADPEHDISITDRGRARLNATIDRGSYESAWRP
jgi:hypothetical protein